MVSSLSPSRPAPTRLARIPTRDTAAGGAFITSVGLHPIEPTQVLGLSSGEICLYAAKTDALSWLLEMNAARTAQLRLGNTAVPSGSTSSAAHADGGAMPLATLAPPENPLKVLSFSTEKAECSIAHCGFLRGRNEDLQREVVQRLKPSSSLTAQHLLYVITSTNDLYVVDIKTDVALLHWVGGDSTSGSSSLSSPSPLSSHFMVTQVETYGALMYLTVARRNAVQAATVQTASPRGHHHLGGGAGSGPERNMYQRCNEPVVYIIHLGYTNLLAAPTTKGLAAGDGAYMIKATSKHRSRQPSSSSGGGGGQAGATDALSICVHPLAPLLLILLDQSIVQIFLMTSDGGKKKHLKAEMMFSFSATGSSGGSSDSVTSASRCPLHAQPVIEAQFVPSATVLVPCHNSGHAPSWFSLSEGNWICCNAQVLLVTPTQLRLVCTRAAAAAAGISNAESSDIILSDRVFYTAPRTHEAPSSSIPTVPNVTFVRAWTWLGSPDSFFALQSDRVIVELSCNDLISASMDVPSVRSRRLQPPRTVASVTRGNPAGDARGTTGVDNWWLIPSPPDVYCSESSNTAASSSVAGVSCVQWPDMLPLWGRGSVLSGIFAPRLPATHSGDPHTLLFSRLTGLARPLPIRGQSTSSREETNTEEDTTADSECLHVSLVADTDSISSGCICVRLCLTPQSSFTPTYGAAALGLPPQPVQDSVNVSIARLLCDSAAPALCRLEHGFYFLGSRAESAYADHPFLVAALVYLDSVVEDEVDGDSPGRTAQLRVAMLCLPADRQAMRHLYRVGHRNQTNDLQGSGAEVAVAPSSELKRALLQAVQHTQVKPLPVPQFDFEVGQSSTATPSKQLLGCAFELSNDGVVPCVWSLWTPLSTVTASSSVPETTAKTSQPRSEPLQLVMQRYYVAADTQELRWRSAELVQMDDPLTANPSQVFSLSGILTATSGSSSPSATDEAVLPPLKPLDDVLLDVDPAVVSQLFLYYADRKVLVLATVETGSSSNSSEVGDFMDDIFDFSSRTGNSRAMGRNRSTGKSEVCVNGTRQHLRLVPYAAAEMNEWKASNTAESLSCSLLTPVQLSAVLVYDHGEPALRVAIVSRRFGVAVALFPLAGRRNAARVSASLLSVKVHLYRRWEELVSVAGTASIEPGDSKVRQRNASSAQAGAITSVPTTYLAGQGRTTRSASDAATFGCEGVHRSPLLRRYKAWADTLAHSTSTYASVSLAVWVWPPAWPGDDEGKHPRRTAAMSPVLLLHRECTLYLLHLSGAAVQMCTSLLHCTPLQVVPHASATAEGSEGKLLLQFGTSLSLVARNRLLRQLQLQYGQYKTSVISPQAATAGKAKWFDKFVRQVHSNNAARLRLRERPQLMEWLQRVYAPTSCELAYEEPSSSFASESSRQMNASLERLTGAGATHVGSNIYVDITPFLGQATLVVEALAVSRCLQQLISSTGTLTVSVRQSLQHITAVLEQDDSGGDRVTEMRTLQGNWAVAEALAELPLACVTRALAQEALQPLHMTETDSTSKTMQRSRTVVSQRWWWLLVRSSSLVSAVNSAQADQVQKSVNRAHNAIPVFFASLKRTPTTASGTPGSVLCGEDRIEAEAVNTVARALLLCSPQLMPHSVMQLLQLNTGNTAPQSPPSSPPQQQHQQQQSQLLGRRLRAAVVTALKTFGVCDSGVTADSASSLASLFSAVRMDSGDWMRAVYYTNLLENLRTIASRDAAAEATSLRELALQWVRNADPAVESVAVAVLEVAAQTVSVLLSDVVKSTEASRAPMATAATDSNGKKTVRVEGNGPPGELLQLRPAKALRGAEDGGFGASGEAPWVENVHPDQHSPIDHTWHHLCEAQWRDLYASFAYPTYLCLRAVVKSTSVKPLKASTAAAAAPPQHIVANPPLQLLYHSRMVTPPQHAQASHTRLKATSATASGSVFANRRGGVKAVFLTEQSVASSSATAPSPVMEVVPVPSTPMSLLRRGEQQPPQLSHRTTVAEEEATLHQTYFAALAATEEGDAKRRSLHPQPSTNSAGYDLHTQSLLQQFRAGLNAKDSDESISPSATRRRKQQQEDRQRVPDPSAFAPSTTRRAVSSQDDDHVNAGVTIGGPDPAEEGALSTGMYGAILSKEDFFTRFASDD